jgi:hypothetical protein
MPSLTIGLDGRSISKHNLPNEIMARSLETIGRDHHANALQFKGRSRWLSLDFL